MRPNTRVVYVESPGSLTFEVQDVPAIAAAAHEAGAKVLMDNTWASPYLFRSFEHGVDVSIHAATKYIVGHSDVMLGAVITNEEMYLPVRTMAADLGHCAGPDDAYFALRGLRTLSVRLERHEKNALAVARWLQTRPEVSRVLYPALPEDPGHALWKRDFLGASGLFGVVLKPAPKAAVYAMIDALDLFGIGSSWGGFESLILPTNPERGRTATRWDAEGPTLRLHIGLEDPQDLIEDLERGFHQLRTSPWRRKPPVRRRRTVRIASSSNLSPRPGAVGIARSPFDRHRHLFPQLEQARHVLDGQPVGDRADQVDMDLRHAVADHRQVEGLGHAGDLEPRRDAAASAPGRSSRCRPSGLRACGGTARCRRGTRRRRPASPAPPATRASPA